MAKERLKQIAVERDFNGYSITTIKKTKIDGVKVELVEANNYPINYEDSLYINHDGIITLIRVGGRIVSGIGKKDTFKIIIEKTIQ